MNKEEKYKRYIKLWNKPWLMFDIGIKIPWHMKLKAWSICQIDNIKHNFTTPYINNRELKKYFKHK